MIEIVTETQESVQEEYLIDAQTSDSIISNESPGSNPSKANRKSKEKFNLSEALFTEMQRSNQQSKMHLEKAVCLMGEANEISREALEDQKASNAEFLNVLKNFFP